MNPCLRLAYNTAREFARRDSRFCISQKKSLAQGKSNCIIRGYYNDKPVVLKFYNDSLKPNSFRRKLTETFFLRHATSTGVVPELLFESDNFIIIEEIVGWTLKQQTNESIDQFYLQQVIAMAMYNAWIRVVRTWKSGLDLYFWGPRFRKRLETYWLIASQL